MSSMNNLDLMIKEASITEQEYEQYKDLINQHINGDLRSEDLPQRLKDVLFEWEIQEMELNSWGNEPIPWEDE